VLNERAEKCQSDFRPEIFPVARRGFFSAGGEKKLILSFVGGVG
jgi:hypothetical protein